MPDASIDSIVTDPPYELGFMGKKWDASGIAYNVELWRECLRVLKPGGHLLAFGGTRTYHRMAVAIEDAGFEVRDSLHWVYGSGFPKSKNVALSIDKGEGHPNRGRAIPTASKYQASDKEEKNKLKSNKVETYQAKSSNGKGWEGWGTALKPAHEPIVVARKPLSGTVAGNVLAHGTGALNIDGCRVAATDKAKFPKAGYTRHDTDASYEFAGDPNFTTTGIDANPTGRWPANLVFTHAADCCQVGTTDVKASGYYPAQRGAGVATGFGAGQPDPTGNRPSGNGDGTETVAVWRCVDGCPVAELDGQSGVSKPKPGRSGKRGGNGFGCFDDQKSAEHNGKWPDDNGGGASRFFTVTEWDPTADVAPFRYVAKPSKRERNAGLDGLPVATAGEMTDRKDGSAGLNSPRAGAGRTSGAANTHPTVKPVALMRWLVRLVTPPGGTVLDPFAGSGTTLVAATLEGFDAIGIEMTDDYLPIIEGRVAWAEEQAADTTPTLFDDAGQGAGVTSLGGEL
jgi:site-specific DNA-methyltransferase (adenine-specific)